MKALLIAPAAFLGLAAAASAADLPPRYAAPVQYVSVPAFTWTGFYLGVHAGYMFGDVDVSLRSASGAAIGFGARGILPERLTIDRSGPMIGAQAGYNIQSGLFVYGIELDISATDANGRARRGYIDPAAGGRLGNTTETRASLDSLGTIRGRVGVAVDRALFYATGGFAYGNTNLKGSIRSTRPIPAFAAYEGRTEDGQLGYAVGVGAEYAVTQNLTARAEYLYHDLGTETVSVRQPARPGNAAEYRFENDGHALRLGLNYKF